LIIVALNKRSLLILCQAQLAVNCSVVTINLCVCLYATLLLLPRITVSIVCPRLPRRVLRIVFYFCTSKSRGTFSIGE